MIWNQYRLTLAPRTRGFHLITREVENVCLNLKAVQVGILHLFIQHTSASLTLNENADPDVRSDMETAMNLIVPETFPFIHTMEGPDDMPAHVKSSMMGSSITVPVSEGRLALGTWQGIYLCEHRNRGGQRRCVATVVGSELPQ